MSLDKHPTIIIVRGLPGSGKSYLAEVLKESLGKDLVVMLDPDMTDYDSKEYTEHVKAQNLEGVDPKLHAYRFLRAKAYEGIAKNKIIIWCQPFTNLDIFNKMVANLRLQAEAHKTILPILVVEVEVGHATAKERIVKRKEMGGHGPSDATFSRFINDYFSFAGAGYTTLTIDGKADVNESITKIKKAISDLPKE